MVKQTLVILSQFSVRYFLVSSTVFPGPDWDILRYRVPRTYASLVPGTHGGSIEIYIFAFSKTKFRFYFHHNSCLL